MKVARLMKRIVASHKQRRPTDKARWRGQSLVELAIMLPLISLILVGTVDLGRAFFYYVRLTNAVREGALFGIQYPAYITSTSVPLPGGGYDSADPRNIVYRVKQESANSAGTPDGDLVITITASSSSDVVCYQGRTTVLKPSSTTFNGDCSQAERGDTIQVRARYNFRPITAQLAGVLGTRSFVMTKTVRMVIF